MCVPRNEKNRCFFLSYAATLRHGASSQSFYTNDKHTTCHLRGYIHTSHTLFSVPSIILSLSLSQLVRVREPHVCHVCFFIIEEPKTVLFCFVYCLFRFLFYLFFFFLVFSIVSLFVLVLFCLFFSCCLPHCLPSDFRTLLSVFLFCSVRSREKKDLKKNEKNVPYWSSVENRLRVPHLSYNPSSWKNFDICMSVYNTAVYPSRSSLAALRIFAFVCPPLWQSLCT